MLRGELQFTKPKNPMDPNNREWDVATEDRIKKIEDRLENLEIHIVEIFRAALGEIEEEKKRLAKENTTEQINDGDDDKTNLDK